MACGLCCATEDHDIQIIPIHGALHGDVLSDQACVKRAFVVGDEASEIFGSVRGCATPTDSGSFVGAAAFKLSFSLVKGQPLGMSLDVSEGSYLRVAKLEGFGPARTHNLMASTDEQIRPGDFIVRVNECRRDAREMMLMLCREGRVEVSLRRPFNFSVKGLNKEDTPLGLDLTYHPKATSLVVRRLFVEGAAKTYNATAPRGLRIQESDHIVAVNGKTGSAEELRAAIGAAKGPVDLDIARPASLG